MEEGREREMSKREGDRKTRKRSQLLDFIFCILISLQLLPGLADDPRGSKDGMKAKSHSTSGSSTGLRVLFICLGLLAFILLSIFIFKKWQQKKREEQHARLLRLFEEDDDLELELGLRD